MVVLKRSLSFAAHSKVWVHQKLSVIDEAQFEAELELQQEFEFPAGFLASMSGSACQSFGCHSG